MRTRSSKGWGQLPRRISLAIAGSKLNVYESRVVSVIVYKTIAFNKTEDEIPRSQFVEITRIADRHLDRTFNSLLKKGMIFKRDSVFGIQEDFSKWETPPLQVGIEETPPLEVKTPPLEVKTPPLEVGSRELLKRAIQEKGLSASKEKKKSKKYLEELHKSRMDFERILKEKKEQ